MESEVQFFLFQLQLTIDSESSYACVSWNLTVKALLEEKFKKSCQTKIVGSISIEKAPGYESS